MQVQDAMAKTIGIATPQDSVRRVAELMKREDAGFIPICAGDSLQGVMTDRDIVLRCLAEGNSAALDEPVEKYMTRNPTTVEAKASLLDAAQIMSERGVRRLPVIDNQKLVGIISHGNLVQATQSEGSADVATVGVTKGA